jgi:hypothetical protein
MKTKIIEATNGPRNWGKFLLGQMTTIEWSRRSVVDTDTRLPLLRAIGWSLDHIWVLDLQTCEGAAFKPGGLVKADLQKHRVWVCPLFEPFLEWLYQQDLTSLDKLPDHVELDAPFQFNGYRRPGPQPSESRNPEAARESEPETEVHECPTCEEPTVFIDSHCAECGTELVLG